MKTLILSLVLLGAISSAHAALTGEEFQLAHPDVLHSFVSATASNTNPLQETWQMYLVIGLLASPLIFWRGTRKPWPLGRK